MSRVKDITGQRFNRLVAIKSTEKKNNNGSILWLCDCDCGNQVIVAGSNLRADRVKSCGCLRSEITRKNIHKAYNTRRKHFGCTYCGSDKHYAKGYCRSCYDKSKKGTLK